MHHARFLLDEIFGVERFLNEIIWAYDFGGRARDKWARKHDNILWYSKTDQWTFNRDEIDRLPYMAPGLVGPEKAARGKLPTDTWWMTIVPTNGTERTGYPTQKPLKLLSRIVTASSKPGDLVADFFAGSGTSGVAAKLLGRRFLLVDERLDAVEICRDRLAGVRRASSDGGTRWHSASARQAVTRFRQATGASPAGRAADGAGRPSRGGQGGEHEHLEPGASRQVPDHRRARHAPRPVVRHPTHRVVRAVSTKARGQHTENPFESATLNLQAFSDCLLGDEADLRTATLDAVAEGDRYPELRQVMTEVVARSRDLASNLPRAGARGADTTGPPVSYTPRPAACT